MPAYLSRSWCCRGALSPPYGIVSANAIIKSTALRAQAPVGGSPRASRDNIFKISRLNAAPNMTASRADYLHQRLAAEGLSSDAISGYIETLRQFLTAKLTKIQFEDEIAKHLPKDKYGAHNRIIIELLQRAQVKREGLPDVPVVQQVKEKRTAPSKVRDAASSKSRPTQTKQEQVPATPTSRMVPLKKNRLERKPNGDTAVASKVNENDKKRPRPPAKQPSPKRPKKSDAPIDGSVPTRSSLSIPSAEIPTYDTLSFQPVRPGQAIDLELFGKMRARMSKKAEKMGVSGGVKDEAIALLTHSLELYIKKIMEAAVQQRVAREGTKPARFQSCHPVTTYDVREGMLADVMKLGGFDASETLERLTLLL